MSSNTLKKRIETNIRRYTFFDQYNCILDSIEGISDEMQTINDNLLREADILLASVNDLRRNDGI